MARISYTINGQTSATLSVTELNTTTTYSSVYVYCNGRSSDNLAYTTSKVYTSRTWTITGLSAGTTYYASFDIRSSGGSTASGGSYFMTESAPPPPPTVGGVGGVYVSNYSMGSISISWSYASYAEDYRIEIYDSWGNYIGATQTSSTSTIYSGLSYGTYYQVKVYGRRYGSSNGSPSWGYITTTDYNVGGVGSVSVRNSTVAGMIIASWSYASNAEDYRVEIYDGNGYYIGATQTSSNSVSYSGLSENTYYQVKVYGRRTGVSNGSPSWGYITTTGYYPQAITTLSVVASTATKGKIDIYWNYATNATGYRWEIYRGNTTSSSYLVVSNSSTSNSVSYSSLLEYTLYTVKVYATRAGYPNGSPMTVMVTTKDLTAPVLSGVTGQTVGKMYLSFSASDAHSGLRTSSTFYTEISSKNGTSYGQGAYSTNKFRTFTADASGYAFEQDAYYYMRVTAYDNEGNSSVSSVRIQFKEGRPNNWAWHTAKTKGNVISLTASEWNSFCTRINQFRRYKSLSNYSFTTVYSGNIITASVVNQARSAILDMSPSSSVPTSAVAGTTVVTALHFNTLSISLNSIQ